MKRIVFFAFVIVSVFLMAACSGISRDEYDRLMDEKNQLTEQVAQLTEERDSLKQEKEQLAQDNTALSAKAEPVEDLKSKNAVLRAYLMTVYDGYRKAVVYVTTEVFGDGLSKSEWETALSTIQDGLPTFDEVKTALNN